MHCTFWKSWNSYLSLVQGLDRKDPSMYKINLVASHVLFLPSSILILVDWADFLGEKREEKRCAAEIFNFDAIR